MIDPIWSDATGALRPMPIPVIPLAGETATGYVGRLAGAHGLPTEMLRSHLLDAAGLSFVHPDLDRAGTLVEQLGDLPLGYFALRTRTHGMFVRCSHRNWQPTRCPRCTRLQAPRSACLRCAHGIPTTTQSRGGGVCMRHRRWHLHDRDIDVRGWRDYLRAEELVSGLLWTRGITLHTGELQLACTLIARWLADGEPHPVRTRAARLGVVDFNSYDAMLLIAYPEAVRLTALLTDGAIVTHLMSPRFSALAQTRLLEATIATIMGNGGTDDLHTLAEGIVVAGHLAVLSAYGLRRTPSSVHAPCELRKALQASARTHRACLLRHMEARNLAPIVKPRIGGAPRTVRLNRWDLQPDEGVLQ